MSGRVESLCGCQLKASAAARQRRRRPMLGAKPAMPALHVVHVGNNMDGVLPAAIPAVLAVDIGLRDSWKEHPSVGAC